MLEKRFLNATIDEIPNSTAWVLKVTYNYYGLYQYTDCFVYGTQDDCIKKLCLERCHNLITIKNKTNIVIDINPDKL
tara:strand:+ start:237 stop:467 length:231 start_codon:yes stop_codon:yes gene_type:complete